MKRFILTKQHAKKLINKRDEVLEHAKKHTDLQSGEIVPFHTESGDKPTPKNWSLGTDKRGKFYIWTGYKWKKYDRLNNLAEDLD